MKPIEDIVSEAVATLLRKNGGTTEDEVMAYLMTDHRDVLASYRNAEVMRLLLADLRTLMPEADLPANGSGLMAVDLEAALMVVDRDEEAREHVAEFYRLVRPILSRAPTLTIRAALDLMPLVPPSKGH